MLMRVWWAATMAVLMVGLLVTLPVVADDVEGGDEVELLRTDSRAPYVHRITLYDHNGAAIDPTDELAGPYSPRMTCSKCHPYSVISHGWHFNAALDGIPAGRPGEPWLLVDPETSTQLPISGRSWFTTFTPADANLSHWDFVKTFGRHTPGGGFGEPTNEQIAASEYEARWAISGRLEIDCMFCHSTNQRHDPAEASRQIERENFKWAPTAALGLALVRGSAKDLPDDWDPMMPDPSNPDLTGPELQWDLARFDGDDRVFFNITARPPNERCYFCHTVREVGPEAPELPATQDVHMAAGLLCVDCHRHGLDHMMVRGYGSEAAERGQPALAAYTCEGCHLGVPDADDPTVRLGGHYGAPHPQHRGLPPLHFEKLTCTACHSGPWPGMRLKLFQTALSHGLGLPSRERSYTDYPHIFGSVFGRQKDDRIAPQRMLWATRYARVIDGKSQPVTPTELRRVAGHILEEQGASGHSADRETIDAVLSTLAAQHEEPTFYYYFDEGERISGPWEGTPPGGGRGSPEPARRWSFAHDVRPAAQALGARGCEDCHALDGPIFFGNIATSRRNTLEFMSELHSPDTCLPTLWSVGFIFRPLFKWFAYICAILIALILLRNGLRGFQGDGGARVGLNRLEWGFYLLGIIGALIQAVTGFLMVLMEFLGPLIASEFSGWLLLAHMVGAPLFVVGLTGTVVHWAPRCRFGARPSGLFTGQKFMFWISTVVGFITMLAMLAAMVPVFGYAGQEELVEIHLISAILFVVVMIVHTFVSLAARRARVEAK
ncbi:MAG: hypothetical protein ABIG44_04705 [Planctomycetota bacterium]